jgi:hypothetical protein
MAITLDGTAGITTPDLTDSSLTSGRVVYAGTGGNLSTSANLIFDGNNLGVGVTPNTWGSAYKAIQFSTQGSIANDSGNQALISYGVNFYRNASADWTYIQTAPATKLTQFSGEFQFLAAPSGTAGTTITWTQIISASKGNTFALEGATSTTGAGIAFPATQSASSNANTLDDYEEGTWTPSIGGTATYSGRSGNYVKIGRVVYLDFYIEINVLGTGSTTSITGGVPFNCSNTIVASGSTTYQANLATSVVSIGALFIGSTSIRFDNRTAASATAAQNAVFANTTAIYGSITYLTTT